jgi:hypothetical protein
VCDWKGVDMSVINFDKTNVIDEEEERRMSEFEPHFDEAEEE